MRLPILAAALLGLTPILHAQTGAPDPTFGTGGRVVLDPSGTLDSAASDVVVLPDGRILLSGTVGGDGAVLRLTVAGALDPTYGVAGVRRVDLGGSADAFTDLALLPDGAAVAVGASTDATDTAVGAVVVRLLPGGGLDTGFGEAGFVREPAGEANAFLALAVQPDGRLVAVGQFEDGSGDSRFVAVRYLAGGARDASFGTAGRAAPAAVTAPGDAVAVDALGRVVVTGIVGVAGSFFDTEIRTSRLTPAGALDPAFGTGGTAVAPLGPGFNIAFAVVVDAAGRATVGGGAIDFVAETADLVLLRYTPTGAADATFGTGGIIRTSAFGAAIAFDLALQSDGKLLVGGSAAPSALDGGDFLLARFTASGAPDTAFGTGGRTVLDLAGDDQALALALQSDGRAVLAGQRVGADGVARAIAVARFVTDGRPVAGDTPPAGAGVFALTAAPNPFGGQTAVTLALAEAGAARVAVYDALGRLVAVLHDGPLAAGERAFRVDGSGLAPGLYVVRAEGAGAGAAVRIVRR